MSPENKKSKDRKGPGKNAGVKPGDSHAAATEHPVDANVDETKRRRPSGRRENVRRDEGEGSEYVEKVLTIKRVTKVTKGGKRLAFSALVVVGDGKGHVGYGLEKAGKMAAEAAETAISALAPFGGKADFLRSMCRGVLVREK